MKIGIACYPTVGGSGILATELGFALAERGHDVHFLAYSDLARTPKPASRIHVHRVEVSAYPLFKYPPYDLALSSKMRDVLEVFDLDILHVHYAIPHALCAYLARQMLPGSRCATVVTLHGTDITVVGNDPAYRVVTKFGLDQSDAVVAVSEYLRHETLRLFQPAGSIAVIPNFVDTTRFRPTPDRAFKGPPIIAHLSNYRPVKRPTDVVRSFALVRRSLPAKLWLLGDGPELPACLDLAKSLGVEEDVTALGLVRSPEDLLPSVHLLMQPSGSEAFGLAALEAMACGVPVVGYRVGGLPEVVVDSQTGHLVEFGDVQALAERAIEILDDPHKWHRMRAASRQRAETEFSLVNSVALHENLYRSVLRTPRE